jgi:hypothetical protein
VTPKNILTCGTRHCHEKKPGVRPSAYPREFLHCQDPELQWQVWALSSVAYLWSGEIEGLAGVAAPNADLFEPNRPQQAGDLTDTPHVPVGRLGLLDHHACDITGFTSVTPPANAGVDHITIAALPEAEPGRTAS